MFCAQIKSVFSVTGRGTYLGVEILEGQIRVGDWIRLTARSGVDQTVRVHGVEFIDYIAQRRADVGLHVPDLDPGDVPVSGEVRGVDPKSVAEIEFHKWLKDSGLDSTDLEGDDLMARAARAIRDGLEQLACLPLKDPVWKGRNTRPTFSKIGDLCSKLLRDDPLDARAL